MVDIKDTKNKYDPNGFDIKGIHRDTNKRKKDNNKRKKYNFDDIEDDNEDFDDNKIKF